MKMKTFAVCVALLITIGVCEAIVCCINDQFEGLQGMFNAMLQNGKSLTQVGTAKMSFDYSNKRLFMSYNLDTNGTQTEYEQIINYQTHMQYMIINGVCHKSSNNATMPSPCIPDNAQLLQTASIGFGSTKIPTKTYQYVHDGSLVYATVTTDCIPILAVAKGSENGVNFADTIGYFNITKGIQNATVFTPPTSCNSPVVRMTPKRHVRAPTFMGHSL